MRDNLSSDHPGIVDDTSDGDLGADVTEPVYGSLAQSEADDVEARRTNEDSDADADASGHDVLHDGGATGGHEALVDADGGSPDAPAV